MINQAQVLSVMRWILTSAGGYAVGRGWMAADQVDLILGVAAQLVPLIWSIYVHKGA